ncbi:hypothetical protein [Streptomyces fungicidicus]|uniref:hypothetical protein n=1 Tax=Streptomyces fungicidicus TaxID=68203 RepID=UPI0036BFAB21
MVELGGMAPASRGAVFSDGWDDGVTAVSEALVGIADREWSRRGGPSAGGAELAVHITDVRQCERADLVRLERFVRENVLPRTTGRGRRSVHGADGERRRGRHRLQARCRALRPGRKAALQDGKPGGWHKADASIWNDLSAARIPHAAL